MHFVPVSTPVGSSTSPYFSLMFFVQFFSNIDVLNQLVGNKSGSPGTVGSISQLFEVEKVSNFLRLL